MGLIRPLGSGAGATFWLPGRTIPGRAAYADIETDSALTRTTTEH